jgi:YD repeat-containing protein
MNTYTYDPLIGITSKTDQSNNTTFYFYDEFGRLKTIKDNDLNIIKDFDYQYGNQ